jgi:hypothetical protein
LKYRLIIIIFIIFLSGITFTQTYNWDKVDKVSISLPPDWEKDENLDSFLNEILKFRHKTYKDFTITITYKRLINFDSSRNYAHFDAGVLKKNDYVIIENSSRAINRIPAYEYIYRYYTPIYDSFEKDFFTMRKIYVVIGKDYYSFIFISPALFYAEYQQILDKIIDNFLIELK